MTRRRKVALVLSGGGARCFAQIGVLQALEEGGLRPAAICGTSTGALLGALYAAGHSAERLCDIAKGLDYGQLLTRGDKGLLSHDGLMAALGPYLPETFAGLEVPLAVAAVDIQNAELLVFREGPLLLAACASNAFPGLFEPVEYQGRYLMDGGILDNFPLDLAPMLTHAPVLGIDTVPSAKRPLEFENRENHGLMQQVVAVLRGEGLKPPLLVEVLEKAYTITQTRLIELRSAMFPAQAVIRPELPIDLGIEEFGRFEEVYRLGYEAGRRFLEGGLAQLER